MNDFECEFCGGPPTIIGRLGLRTWFRCRNCGMDYSTTEDIDEEFDLDEFDPEDELARENAKFESMGYIDDEGVHIIYAGGDR